MKDRRYQRGTCLLWHVWGPWRPGTAYETFNGQRTGRSTLTEGRECLRCGVRQVR